MRLNDYGKSKEPFFFIIDFALKEFTLSHLSDLDKDIKFSMDSPKSTRYNNKKIHYDYEPVSLERYKKSF